ncbi:hypothetical protein P691DRAFT_765741 [Macrolepiota fuliginosa MF-IS2]|uniref:Uncharacterized protein n=1 Tax=Macrolepiota fuliginosa MF-IS2 TaxID=1400762 RepID=A0A9P5X0E4_9AGAR|nr:hypothetical protein P691DRAFT_765741 [Macrolepiota fuliginosa MF-IS2]
MGGTPVAGDEKSEADSERLVNGDDNKASWPDAPQSATRNPDTHSPPPAFYLSSHLPMSQPPSTGPHI